MVNCIAGDAFFMCAYGSVMYAAILSRDHTAHKDLTTCFFGPGLPFVLFSHIISIYMAIMNKARNLQAA